jgi:hypothetical protein
MIDATISLPQSIFIIERAMLVVLSSVRPGFWLKKGGLESESHEQSAIKLSGVSVSE